MMPTFTIAIPAYGRPAAFKELLSSINQMDPMPNEVLICEDFSKERKEISTIADHWKPILESQSCALVYIENEENLGYDTNLRKLIEQASSTWVILMGNDDLMLKDAIGIINDFCNRNPNIPMISRPFIRFDKNIDHPLGLSRMFKEEAIINKETHPPGFFIRASGALLGLVINKKWALDNATDKYDGSLFYQIYLACVAYCTDGIGYLKKETVASRVGSVPSFGASKKEQNIHTPGRFTIDARMHMLSSILKISKEIPPNYGLNLYSKIVKELQFRQSFHLFEMFSGYKKETQRALVEGLKKMNLYDHPFPKVLFFINTAFGSYSKIFYKLVRKFYQ